MNKNTIIKIVTIAVLICLELLFIIIGSKIWGSRVTYDIFKRTNMAVAVIACIACLIVNKKKTK